MNVQLYKDLSKAYKFLEKDETLYASKIKYHEERIKQLSSTRLCKPKTPTQIADRSRIIEVLLIIFVWPIGLWYWHKNKINHKNQEIKANEQYVREMQNYNMQVSQIRNEIYSEKQKIHELESQRNSFHTEFGSCLFFIPSVYRSKEAVGTMLGAVENCLADTLKEAINIYIERLKEMAELEHLKEEREERKAQHKDSQKTLSTISDNQLKTKKELENINSRLDADYQRKYHSNF